MNKQAVMDAIINVDPTTCILPQPVEVNSLREYLEYLSRELTDKMMNKVYKCIRTPEISSILEDYRKLAPEDVHEVLSPTIQASIPTQTFTIPVNKYYTNKYLPHLRESDITDQLAESNGEELYGDLKNYLDFNTKSSYFTFKPKEISAFDYSKVASNELPDNVKRRILQQFDNKKCKIWLGRQYYMFSTLTNINRRSKRDDVIMFFNWVTNRATPMNPMYVSTCKYIPDVVKDCKHNIIPATSRVTGNKPSPDSANVVIVLNGKFLVHKRSGAVIESGKIGFPGGIVDSDETPFEAALRELKEEAGIQFTKCMTFTELNDMYSHQHIYVVVINDIGDITVNKCTTPHEIDSSFGDGNLNYHKWMSAKEIRDDPESWAFTQKIVGRAIRQGLV